MNREVLIPFGDGNIATVHPSGIVDIRLVDDKEHRTLTGRMHIDDVARIAKATFDKVRNDATCKEDERIEADTIIGCIVSIEQIWKEQ